MRGSRGRELWKLTQRREWNDRLKRLAAYLSLCLPNEQAPAASEPLRDLEKAPGCERRVGANDPVPPRVVTRDCLSRRGGPCLRGPDHLVRRHAEAAGQPR